MTKETGGSAFPNLNFAEQVTHDSMITRPISQGGMTLRDWFASKYNFEIVNPLWAKEIMGEEPPQWNVGNDLDCIKWWISAESKLRFMHADAMLEARKS